MKTGKSDFTIGCNNCGETKIFINLGGTWAGGLKFSKDEKEIVLECKCGNRIRIK